MAEPRNRKCAQPFTVLGLAGDQDNFLAFGIAGFCHGRLRFEKGAKLLQLRLILSLSKYVTYRLRFSEVGNAGGRSPFAKMHDTDEWPHKVRSVSSPVSARQGRCWKKRSLLFQPPESAISGGSNCVSRLLVQLNEAIWREHAVQ
jgi:hypothetical protein